jgi:hydrogenase small subunit
VAVVALGTCATYGGVHAMEGNPTGAMGLVDYLGWEFRSQSGVPIVCVPVAPVQPDNFMETLLYLLYQAAGIAPTIPLDQAHRPTWLFGKPCTRAATAAAITSRRLRRRLRLAKVHREARLLGPVVLCNVAKRGWMDGIGGCPNVGGICIGCTMPGFPTSSCRSWRSRPARRCRRPRS